MRRISKWLWLVLMLMGLGLFVASCEPETTDDESDLPWSPPEQWEGTPGIGF
jgi:hypothetical protein